MKQQPQKANRIRLAEIAQKAGVSRQVVSAVLNPDRPSSVRYSPETYKKVMAIARQTHWRPNRTAINLARRRHGNIGILVDNFGNIPDNVLPAMMRAAHAFGQVIVLDWVTAPDEGMPLFVREDSVDAIVAFENIPDSVVEGIHGIGLPFVRVNTSVRRGPGCITFDEEGAMAQAATHLAEIGCRKTVLFHPTGDGYWCTARPEGFADAAGGKGMEKPVLVPFDRGFSNPAQYRPGVEQVKKVLAQNPDLDSAILVRDRMAPAFYHAAAELDRKPGRDIAVIGMHSTGVASVVRPPLSTLHIHPGPLGKYVVRIVNAGLDGDDEYDQPLAVRYDLQTRSSSNKFKPRESAR